jgi:sortase A
MSSAEAPLKAPDEKTVSAGRSGRVLRWTGRAFIATGTLILLFLAYQLWGTGFITSHHQSALKQKFFAGVRQAQTMPRPVLGTTLTTTPAEAAKPNLASGIALLEIPKISLSMVVVEGVSVDDLKLGPGHYPGTPLPGEPGNVVISGHRTTYLHPFYNLNELTVGDPITLTKPDGTKDIYLVSETKVVAPTAVEVISNTSDDRLTLTTCNPRYSAAQRLVVVAELYNPQAKPAPA